MHKWIFLLLATLTIATSALADPIKRIVFFGDSITDTGNLYRFFHFIPKSPPYFQGHFSNGPVWSDGVARYFLNHYAVTSSNFAVGGATVELLNPFQGNIPYCLNEEVNNYLLATLFGNRKDTLYFIWIGANDYTGGRPDVDNATTQVVQSITNTITRLIQGGGEHFFIMNLPDISKAPFANSVTYASNLYDLTVAHNKKLLKSVLKLSLLYPKVRLDYFDAGAVFDDMSTHLERYNKQYNKNFKIINESCWKGGYTLHKKPIPQEQALADELQKYLPAPGGLTPYSIINNRSLAEAYEVGQLAAAGITPCTNPDEYIFWDKIHPTTDTHDVVSQLIIKSLLDLKIITD